MSVQSEIDRIKGNIADSFAAIEEMGVAVPENSGSDNLPGAIRVAAATKQNKLTGQTGQVVGFDGAGAALAVRGWSNPNLLINWDFRNPVNRNGQTEYTSPGYTIDRWQIGLSGANVFTLKLFPGQYIALNKNIDGSMISLFEYIEADASMLGKEVTFSVLTKDFGCVSKCAILTENSTYMYFVGNNANNGYAATRFIADGSVIQFTIGSNNNSVKIVAAKLELGPVQTLAHKEGDTWVLNDPPNYDLQYALCSLYSPSTGAWVGYQHSNPNLLDNWYFADPINQRGKTEYTGNNYTIDRWQGGNTTSVQLNAGLVVSNQIRQKIEPGRLIPNQQYTLSVLIESVEGGNDGQWLDLCLQRSGGDYNSPIRLLRSPMTGLYTCTGYLPYFEEGYQFVFVSGNVISTIKAAKLELGSQQTLAHQDDDGNWVLNDPPPNKALELAKCQRYFQVFSSEDLRPVKAVDFRPVMRINPTFGTINIDGVTYYTADANL